ncbi:MAG: D-alanyl-D-alanine carboxypeptidase [Gammaproteobacteria bacterium]|nr:MAG: D-alanyl-D-alanine carboxypeptidase [Gammaproteobacteria bacterium]
MNNEFSKIDLNDKTLTGRSDQHIVWLTSTIGIHKQMLNAWKTMQKAALNDGILLKIVSGFRSFERQLMLWNNKYQQITAVKDHQNNPVDLNKLSAEERIKAILVYSALPAASRHHWGTDIDVYAPNLLSDGQKLQLEPWEYLANGPMAPLTLWLQENCSQYGFYFPYNKDRGGVAIEPWHLSYAPLSKIFTAQLTEELLKGTLQNSSVAAREIVLKQLPFIYKNFIMNVNSLN